MSGSRDEQIASHPAVDPAELAQIAARRPDLQARVVENPAAYEGLLLWLSENADDPRVRQRAAERLRVGSSTGAEASSLAPTPGLPPVEGEATSGASRAAEGKPRAARPLVWLLAAGATSLLLVVAAGVVAGAVVTPAEQELRETRGEHSSAVEAEERRRAAQERVEEERRRVEEETVRAAAAEAARLEEEQRLADQASRSWNFANKSGYSYQLFFDIGTPQRASANIVHPAKSGFVAGSVCGLDPDKDVVIPVTLNAAATTDGYATPIQARFVLNSGSLSYQGTGISPSRGDNRVKIEQSFSDDSACSTVSSTNIWGYGQPPGIGVSWNDPIEKGRTVRHALFLIVTDYYLPAHPQGDPALLDYIAINPIFGGDNTDAAKVYTPVDGANLGTYSNRRITLSGNLVD